MKANIPLIDIRPDHWEIVQGILQKHVPGYEVWAFGSRATWKAKPYSDLDLAIITDQPLSLDVSASLSDDFSESDLPWKVDVVDWATTSESFRKIIERDRVVVRGDDREDLMNEWKQIELGNVCLKIGSGATPRGGKDAYKGGNTALIRSQNIHNDRFMHDGLVYINNSQANELRNVTVEKGDVLLNITGDSVARCCQVDPEILPARVNQHVAIIRPRSEFLDARFLRYVLVSNSMQSHLLALSSAGATRNALTKGMIESLLIRSPCIHKQRAIAHILGTLDDKIELNRRMNETLEAMARTLFKAWFVDFEPVRAKIEGRWKKGESLPGLPAHLYDVFPDKLVDSELGEIPEGWEVKTVDQVGKVICGKTPSTSITEYYGQDIPFITIPEMHGAVFASNIKKRLSIKGAKSQQNKTLPPQTICISCIATPGLVSITTELSQTNQQINSVIPFDSQSTVYYWYWVFKNLGEEIKASGSGGSVLSNLSTGRFSQLKVNASNVDLRLIYQNIVASMFEKILTNQQESKNLSLYRNTLLPKLISGELRIADAEQFIRRIEEEAPATQVGRVL